MMAATVQPHDFAQETRAAFAVFDRDGSGTISASELKAVMKSLGENLTDAEIDEMIGEADKNRNGTIDCEFLFSFFLFFSFFALDRIVLDCTGLYWILYLRLGYWDFSGWCFVFRGFSFHA